MQQGNSVKSDIINWQKQKTIDFSLECIILLSYYKNGQKIIEKLMKIRSMMVQSYENFVSKMLGQKGYLKKSF